MVFKYLVLRKSWANSFALELDFMQLMSDEVILLDELDELDDIMISENRRIFSSMV